MPIVEYTLFRGRGRHTGATAVSGLTSGLAKDALRIQQNHPSHFRRLTIQRHGVRAVSVVGGSRNETI